MDEPRVKSSRRGIPHLFRKSTRPATSFSHSQLVPDAPPQFADVPEMPNIVPFGAPPDLPTSRHGSVSPTSVFEGGDGQADGYNPRPVEITHPGRAGVDDNPQSYDLKPPPPSVQHSNVETLAMRLFSSDHLNVILRDQSQSLRFSKFIQQYKPAYHPLLKEYLELQKVLSAVEYANAVADQLPSADGQPGYPVAQLDENFEARAQETVEDLVGEALPAYITHRLTQIATDSLVKEITGQGTPLMREMIPSLAEVYCVTDPSLPDNPIVYASEEFYNISQYGKDYVIGRNCRFLQGPKTSTISVKRLIEALAAGQECTETILNYRRDGTPFMNLLLIAPLYDNKGTVRYFIGCQIDVSPLIEGGRGLESFEHLLSRDRADSRFGGRIERRPAEVLSELSAMFNETELDTMRSVQGRFIDDASNTGKRTPTQSASRSNRPGGRRILGMDDDAASNSRVPLWPSASLGPSGRLPGVYQNYLLVRPYPSLRITFTSPALRIPGLLQTKFLDRVGGPTHVRDGILDALAHGTSVTAKISWLATTTGDGKPAAADGKPRWIHCTPLLGSDEKVGVWMVVMVEQEEVTGSLNRGNNYNNGSLAYGGSVHSSNADPHALGGPGSPRIMNGDKLYQEYLRREGREVQRSEAGSMGSRPGTGRRGD